MARKKETATPVEEAAPQESGGEGTATPAARPLSKAAMVRAAVDELGDDATTENIQQFLLDRYQTPMKTQHISSSKSNYLKDKRENAEKGKGGKKRGRPRGTTKVTVDNGTPAVPTIGAPSLKYLRNVRDLVDVIGVARFRDLLDLLYPPRGEGSKD